MAQETTTTTTEKPETTTTTTKAPETTTTTTVAPEQPEATDSTDKPEQGQAPSQAQTNADNIEGAKQEAMTNHQKSEAENEAANATPETESAA